MRRIINNIIFMAFLYSACFLISYFNPFVVRQAPDAVKYLFSFAGMLFAILSGFFISSLWDRFTRIRTLVAYETASLENIYKFCELVDSAIAKKAVGLIDRYVIEALNNDLDSYQEEVRDEYFALYDLHKALKGKESEVPYTRLLNIFDQFTKSRKEIFSRVKDRLGIHQWIALVLLTFLIAFLWLHMQFPGPAGVMVGSVLIFSIAIVLFIVFDLNNPNWCGDMGIIKVYDVNVEVYERVFDVLEVPRYYPQELLKEVKIPDDVNEYRVGVRIDKKSKKREIELKRR